MASLRGTKTTTTVMVKPSQAVPERTGGLQKRSRALATRGHPSESSIVNHPCLPWIGSGNYIEESFVEQDGKETCERNPGRSDLSNVR